MKGTSVTLYMNKRGPPRGGARDRNMACVGAGAGAACPLGSAAKCNYIPVLAWLDGQTGACFVCGAHVGVGWMWNDLVR